MNTLFCEKTNDLEKYCLLLRELYYHIDSHPNHEYIKITPRGYSVDIRYVLDYKDFEQIFELTTLYPYSREVPNRIRFMKNNDRWPIHKDKNLGLPAQKSLIFPLINCNKKTVTTWHELIVGNVEEKSNAFFVTNPYLTKILHEESFIEDTPIIIRVDQWHSADNHSKKERVIAGLFID